ncbi:MAG: hypothetical protein KDK40_04910, partial [Chlamydiia bacterium]|nr:hypothetical protein [Chlamydiia bacterium]
DMGAQVAGRSNLEIAQEMAERARGSNTEAIVFFDEGERCFKSLKVDTGEVMPFIEGEIDPKRRQTNYDQNRCFGADIRQDPRAVALLLLGHRPTKDLVDQAAGRMRGLHRGQGVEWLIPEAEAQKMFQGKQPNAMELLLHLIDAQLQEEEEVNFETQMQQMENELRRARLDKLQGISKGVEAAADVDEALRLYHQWRKQLLSHESCDPAKLYGGLGGFVPSQSLLERCLQAQLKELDEDKGLTAEEKEAVRLRMKRYPEGWSQLYLPALHRQGDVGLGVECEVFAEEEQEVEVETQVEQQAEYNPQDAHGERQVWEWAKDLDLRERGWERPEAIMEKQGLIRFTQRIHAACGTVERRMNRLMGQWEGFSKRVSLSLSVRVGERAGRIAEWTLSGAKFAAIGAACLFGGMLGIGATLGFAATYGLAKGGRLATGWLLMREPPKSGCPLFRATDLLQLHLPQSHRTIGRFFTPHLLVSNNYFAHQPGSLFEHQEELFHPQRKPLYQLLLIEDGWKNGNRQWTGILVDQNDSAYFHG